MNLKRSITVAQARQGLTSKALAEKLGMSQSSLSQIKAQVSCTGATLQKMAKVFGMKVSEFVALGED